MKNISNTRFTFLNRSVISYLLFSVSTEPFVAKWLQVIKAFATDKAWDITLEVAAEQTYVSFMSNDNQWIYVFFLKVLKYTSLKNQIKMKYCSKSKTNLASFTGCYNKCLVHCSTSTASLFRHVSSFFAFVVFPKVSPLVVVTLNISSQRFCFIATSGSVTPLRKITEIWQHVGFIHQWLKVRQLKKKLTTAYHAMFSNITRWS